jgi:hypothetical protein
MRAPDELTDQLVEVPPVHGRALAAPFPLFRISADEPHADFARSSS